ncbi:uncharacterized protein GGS22DRAFT_169798 [Annulohypoxylon maeteangense]|uniref:uncharacterized protein n=1 Tax=Annulohypoxylon maeteangense TaxID=1927788 RepID=UPI002007B825|nr:uncharacterized protein GGS22DRAFT_169798 [Annulohypoxylon maeteangense]KAI0882585.1 hypothetical protein GGS22DRAFT_169798 [Annulohypoxylon maeteangense]
MSTSLPAPPKHKPIQCGGECYCAICGVPFGGYIYQNNNQVRGRQPCPTLKGAKIGYNPRNLGGWDKTAWVRGIYFVGYLPDEDETIMSGKARLVAEGVIELYPDDKRNETIPSEYDYECYRLSEDKITVHPFHWPCLEILARILNPKAVDPVLHIDASELDSSFSSLSNSYTGLELLTGANKRHGKP